MNAIAKIRDDRQRRIFPMSKNGFVVALVTASLLVGCSRMTPTERAQKELSDARQSTEEGKTSVAIIEYRRALQDDPKLAVAHFELGKLFVKQGDLLTGFRQLNASVELDGSNADARLALADLLLAGKNYSDAKVQADEVLKLHAGDSRALLIEAKSFAGMGQLKDAHTTVDKVLQSDPTNANAWLLLAGLQFQEKDFVNSDVSFRRTLEYDPAQVAAVAAFTVLLLQQNRVGEAEAVIRDSVAKNPRSANAQYVLGAFLWQQQRLPEAEAAFKAVAQFADSDPQQRSALATFYVGTKQFDLAEKEFSRIIAAHGDDYQTRDALAALYLSTGKQAQAETVLNEVLAAQAENDQALLLRGELRIQQTRLDEAVADLQHATRANASSAAAHYYLATAQLQRGEAKVGEAELRTTIELAPDFLPARTLLAGLEMDRGELRQSLEQLDKVVTKNPASLDPYIMHSVILSESGEAQKGEKDLLPLLDRFTSNDARVSTLRALALVMLNGKKYDEARIYLRKADQLQPNSKETLYLLGLSYVEQNNTDSALSLIQSRLQHNPKWADGYDVAGNIAFAGDRFDLAENYFRQAIALDANSAGSWQGLGDSLVRESKYRDAVEAFNNAISHAPKSGPLYMRLGILYDRLGNWDKAEEAYQKVLQLQPEDAAAKNNLAWDYSEHGGNIEVALRLAQEASRSKPDDPEISDTLGWVYIRMNTPETAVSVLKGSVDKKPNNPEYSYHLGIAYLRSGRIAEARHYLQAALNEPNFPQADDARKMLGSINN